MRKGVKEGWKVTTSWGRSCIISGYGEVEYKVGEKTFPQKDCGPLAVFTSEQTAKDFFIADTRQSFNPKARVHKCLYKQSKEKELYRRPYRDTATSYLMVVKCKSIPKDTDYADWVEILD
jgi:hypothetical protein